MEIIVTSAAISLLILVTFIGTRIGQILVGIDSHLGNIRSTLDDIHRLLLRNTPDAAFADEDDEDLDDCDRCDDDEPSSYSFDREGMTDEEVRLKIIKDAILGNQMVFANDDGTGKITVTKENL